MPQFRISRTPVSLRLECAVASLWLSFRFSASSRTTYTVSSSTFVGLPLLSRGTFLGVPPLFRATFVGLSPLFRATFVGPTLLIPYLSLNGSRGARPRKQQPQRER